MSATIGTFTTILQINEQTALLLAFPVKIMDLPLMHKFTLAYTARSKKNSRPIFFNKKIKRHFLGKSKHLREFEKKATADWKGQFTNLGLVKPMSGPLQAKYFFYYSGAQKADICNLIVTLNDLAQDAGVIENDKDIKLILEAAVFENSGVDRCEFYVGPKTDKASRGVSVNEASKYLQQIAKAGADRKDKIQGPKKAT